MMRRPPRSPLFPYTPLFRSRGERLEAVLAGGERERLPPAALQDLPEVGVQERHELVDERSEEHTSELQSRSDLVCRLLLEKKKTSKETEQVVIMLSSE